jgi:hypothetical protein
MPELTVTLHALYNTMYVCTTHTLLCILQSERQYTACHAEPRSGLLNKWLGGTVPIDKGTKNSTGSSSSSNSGSAFAPPAADTDGT